MTELSPINFPTLNISRMERVPVLDHGYVELIENWGSDEAIVEAARMSTDKGFLGWEPGPCPVCDGETHVNGAACRACEGKGEIRGDKHLLRYLWNNKHSTPFEFAGMTIEVQAPLIVFREWHRHRTQSYAERSARYTPLPNFNYMPTPERLLRGGGHLTKQAASVDGVRVLDYESALEWLDMLGKVYEHAEVVYQVGLEMGIPKELARLSMTVGRYSTMRASTDLRNWLGFATLRLPKNAQEEIRVYAEVAHTMLTHCFPRTLALFDEGMK